MKTHLSLAIPLGGMALIALVAGCSDSGNNNTMPQVTQSIDASEQTANPANHVVVSQVKSVGAGWAVIHEASGPTFGDAIGHVAVSSGTSSNVAVTLDRDVVDGETLYAVLHDDLGTMGTFEYPGVDVPATEGGQVVKDVFVVHLPGVIHPAITANDQSLSTLSTEVTVASAVSDGPGWAVIHEQSGGEAGAVIGHAHLDSGTNTNVKVTLDRPAVDGETLYAMLHTDLGTVGTFEFPGVDAPVTVGGDVVMTPFVVTVPAGTPAIRFRVSSVGSTAYTFSQVEPAAYAGTIGAGGNNPTLTLRSGWRYQITNTVSSVHPFELLTRGATFGSDLVLLSEAGLGTLEGDVTIVWSDSQGVLRFTVSPALAAALTGYRCAAHPAAMRGPITIQ